MPLTPEQKQKYLANPDRCPVCGHEDFDASSFEMCQGVVEQKLTCKSCDRIWWDHYTLTDVELDERDPSETRDCNCPICNLAAAATAAVREGV